MIPEGWVYLPIKELCESIVDCVNKTAPVVDYETPYKMIRTTNVRHGKVDTENVRCVDKETFEKWVRRGAPKKGDIIFTREAPVGEAGLLDSNDMLFLGQRTMMYRPDRNKSNNLFILYSLQTRFCQKQIENFSNGGTVTHMRVPDCGKIMLRVPPLLEQKKIAEILSTWDKAIETVEKLIANSQQKKKALMQQLLTGQKRFPEFDGEWKEVRLENICKIATGKKDVNEGNPHGLYPFYTCAAAPTKSDSYSFDCEAILIAGNGAIGTTHYYEGKFEAYQRTYVLSEFSNIDCRYLYHFINTFFIQDVEREKQHGAMPYIKLGLLKKFKLMVPSLEEQIRISLVLDNVGHDQSNLICLLNNFQKQKKALMQQLLTGKRRVKMD